MYNCPNTSQSTAVQEYNVLKLRQQLSAQKSNYNVTLSRMSSCSKTEQQNIQGNTYLYPAWNYLLHSAPAMLTAVRVPTSAKTPKQNFKDKPGQNGIWKVLCTCWFPKRE
jgi:hypothetical protein